MQAVQLPTVANTNMAAMRTYEVRRNIYSYIFHVLLKQRNVY